MIIRKMWRLIRILAQGLDGSEDDDSSDSDIDSLVNSEEAMSEWADRLAGSLTQIFGMGEEGLTPIGEEPEMDSGIEADVDSDTSDVKGKKAEVKGSD